MIGPCFPADRRADLPLSLSLYISTIFPPLPPYYRSLTSLILLTPTSLPSCHPLVFSYVFLPLASLISVRRCSCLGGFPPSLHFCCLFSLSLYICRSLSLSRYSLLVPLLAAPSPPKFALGPQGRSDSEAGAGEEEGN